MLKERIFPKLDLRFLSKLFYFSAAEKCCLKKNWDIKTNPKLTKYCLLLEKEIFAGNHQHEKINKYNLWGLTTSRFPLKLGDISLTRRFSLRHPTNH